MTVKGRSEQGESLGALFAWLGQHGDQRVRGGIVLGMIGLFAAAVVGAAALFAYQQSANAAARLIGESNLSLARAVSLDPHAKGDAALDELATRSEVAILRLDANAAVLYHSETPWERGANKGAFVIDVEGRSLTLREIIAAKLSGYGICTANQTRSQVSFAYDSATGGLTIVRLPWSEVEDLFLSAAWPWLLAVAITIIGVIPAALLLLVRALLREARRRDAAERSDSRKLGLLIRAQKFDALGKMAAGIAHDFNNSLVAIRGNAEMLIDGRGVDTAAAARRVLSATERAGDLAQRLLVVSSHEATPAREFSSTDSVNEFCGLWRGAMGREATLTAKLPLDPCDIEMDEVQFHQVLLNLVVNAREAIEGRGSVEITVGRTESVPADALPRRDGGSYVRIVVADDGPGIDPAVLREVFDWFSSSRTADHARGLGLAVVFEVVSSVGGAVRVDSAPGKGARFEVYVPAASARGDVSWSPIAA